MDVYNETRVIAAGTQAPRFMLPAQDGQSVTLDQLINDRMALLFFYSKNGHPGVSQELGELNEYYNKFREVSVNPVAISSDDDDSHRQYANKHKFEIPLLADPTYEVAKYYGVWNSNGNNSRVTFIISKEQEIVRVYADQRIRSHVKEVYTNIVETLVE